MTDPVSSLIRGCCCSKCTIWTTSRLLSTAPWRGSDTTNVPLTLKVCDCVSRFHEMYLTSRLISWTACWPSDAPGGHYHMSWDLRTTPIRLPEYVHGVFHSTRTISRESTEAVLGNLEYLCRHKTLNCTLLYIVYMIALLQGLKNYFKLHILCIPFFCLLFLLAQIIRTICIAIVATDLVKTRQVQV